MAGPGFTLRLGWSEIYFLSALAGMAPRAVRGHKFCFKISFSFMICQDRLGTNIRQGKLNDDGVGFDPKVSRAA
jgi:hypothetical protein